MKKSGNYAMETFGWKILFELSKRNNMITPKNVLGGNLELCSKSPVTGFFRNGYCDTCEEDFGIHSVCCIVTEEFLSYSKSVGNDLSTPRPEYNFSGLKAGDKWCVSAPRWKQAYDDGFACPVVLESTHEDTLDIIDFDILAELAI